MLKEWTRFERYIHREHAKLFLFVFFALCSVYTLGAFLDVVDDALERRVSAFVALKVALLKLPYGVKELGSMAILVSVMLFLAISSKHLEPVILRSLGIRLGVYLRPLLQQALVLSFFLAVNAFYIAPHLLALSKETYKVEIKGEKRAKMFTPVGIWIKASGYFCYIGYFDEQRKLLKDVRCFNPDNTTLYTASLLVWDRKRWIGKGRFWSEKEYRKLRHLQMDFLPSPEDLSGRRKGPDEMGMGELISVAYDLYREGISVREYLWEIGNRMALSLTPVVMVLFAFPMGISEPRKGQVALAFVKGLGLAVAFYSVFYGFSYLGRESIMNPLAAAALPVILTALVGYRMAKGVDE